MALLELRGVCKSFHDGVRSRVVFDHVSFEMDAGETLGVLASRLAGKTTLLNIIAGLERPDKGSVWWEGNDLARLSADRCASYRRHRGIALASCDWRSVDTRLVVAHVAIPLYSDGLKMSRAEECAHRALEWVDASHLGHRMTDRLGMSERVRVELARALVREPRLLLVDEPLLPRPSEAREFFALLHGLPRRLGLALVIASEEVSAVRGARVMSLDGRGRLSSTDHRRKVVELRPGRGASPGGP